MSEKGRQRGEGPHEHAIPASLLAGNETLAEHVLRPRNIGRILHPDGLGEAARECGDSLEFSLEVRDGHVARIAVMPRRSCAVTLACASMASTLAEGQSLPEARKNVTARAIMEALDGLPEGEEHAASLAAQALRAAIDDAISTVREPWRRAYRR